MLLPDLLYLQQTLEGFVARLRSIGSGGVERAPLRIDGSRLARVARFLCCHRLNQQRISPALRIGFAGKSPLGPADRTDVTAAESSVVPPPAAATGRGLFWSAPLTAPTAAPDAAPTAALRRALFRPSPPQKMLPTAPATSPPTAPALAPREAPSFEAALQPTTARIAGTSNAVRPHRYCRDTDHSSSDESESSRGFSHESATMRLPQPSRSSRGSGP